ncbi:MAG TPA: TauD/TfdA family dioxygenase [Acidimicrobiales bacterium]
MKFIPVAGSLGAEVVDLDLRALSEREAAQLQAGLHEFEVVFIRGADLDDDEHLALGGRFGPVNLFPFSKVMGATEPVTLMITDGPTKPTADGWHTDVTYALEPPDYAFLQAVIVPERGGDTIWASTTAAFEALSPTMQALIDGLEVVHSCEGFIAGASEQGQLGDQFEEFAAAYRRMFPPVVHPLVRLNPDTQRKGLFLSSYYTTGIVSMTDAESDALLGLLQRHLEDPRFHCRWSWRPGDLAIWDERSTNHRSAGDHFPQPRALRRIEVGGARPVGAAGPIGAVLGRR